MNLFYSILSHFYLCFYVYIFHFNIHPKLAAVITPLITMSLTLIVIINIRFRLQSRVSHWIAVGFDVLFLISAVNQHRKSLSYVVPICVHLWSIPIFQALYIFIYMCVCVCVYEVFISFFSRFILDLICSKMIISRYCTAALSQHFQRP